MGYWETFVFHDTVANTMSDSVENFYNRWKKPYDLFSSNTVVNKWRKCSIESMRLNEGDTVVDIGCGTGANVPFLYEEVGEEGDVVCLDIAEEPLQMVQKKSQEMNMDNIHTIRADAKRIPIDDADAYFASFSIGMLSNTESIVKDWCSELDKGSKVCFLNVVKSEENVGIINKPLQVFTGMTVPTDLQNKIDLSLSGDALDDLDEKIRNSHNYLKDNHNLIEEEYRFGGGITWISAEIQ